MKSIIIAFLFIPLFGYANDGAFFISGNQLIPIQESDISISKEVLTISLDGDSFANVIVEYEFFNPKEEKTILMGFEAMSPSGDVDGTPINGKHPFMYNFTVLLNNQNLKYNTAIVRDSNYYKNGKVTSVRKEVEANKEGGNYPEFYYVYYFNAKFQKGINKIKHTYRIKLSSSVIEIYSFDYVLTAANRWANKQIDDFTLVLNLNNNDQVQLFNTFFDSSKQWEFDGISEVIPATDPDYPPFTKRIMFYLSTGKMVFQKKNFHPKGELRLSYPTYDYMNEPFDTFDFRKHDLKYGFIYSQWLKNSIDLKSYKILRNLPYAKRGFVFKTKYIQEYYESLPWYKMDKEYIASLDDLNFKELEWLRNLKPTK